MTLTRRLHMITAIAIGLIIVGLLFMIIHPMDWTDRTIEQTYHANEGLIWMIGIFLAVGIGILTFINGLFQNELKDCSDINTLNTTIIKNQNSTIIKNQEKHISEIRILNNEINKNNKHDIETLDLIHKQNETMDSLFRRVEDGENEIKRFTNVGKRLTSIESSLNTHDSDIRALQKKAI